MSDPTSQAAPRSAPRSPVRRGRQTRGRSRPGLQLEALEARQMMTADLGDAIGSAAVFQGSTWLGGEIGDGFWGSRDVDLVGFQVASGGRLTADVDARSLAGGSWLDSYLRVFDSAGRLVASNDDFGGSVDSVVSLVVPAAGTYFVGVSGFGNSAYSPWWAGSGSSGSTGRYALSVSVVNPGPVDGAGDSLAAARDIGQLSGSRSFSDAIGGTDPNDFYRFNVTATSAVDVRLDGLASDADLELLDSAGVVIGSSSVGGTTADTIRQQVSSGTYHVRVLPFAGTTNYTLTLSATPVNQPPMPGPGPVPPTPGPGPALPTPVFRSTTGWGLVDASAAVSSMLGNSTAFAGVTDLGGLEWGNDLVNAPEVWSRGFTGRGVVVAVVDTGVDYDHPDLRQNIWVNPREIAGDGIDNDRNGFVDDVRGWDFVGRDAFPMDVVDNRIINGERGNSGHGTHVAGTIAATANGIGSTGVAPEARIMPVRVLDQRGSGFSSNIARGIRYAADNGAHVINLSLGGGYSSDEESAIRHAVSRGCVVVIAAGNDGQSLPMHPARHAATIPGVISVGAVDRDQRLASWSHRAGSDSRMRHVVAPGVSIHSTLPGGRYETASGTSMAAPHVAGVAALIRSAAAGASPQQIQERITSTARQPARAALLQSAATAAPRLGLMQAFAFAALAAPEGGVAGRPRAAAQAGFAALAARN